MTRCADQTVFFIDTSCSVSPSGSHPSDVGVVLTPNYPHARLRLHRHPHCVCRFLPLRHLHVDLSNKDSATTNKRPEESESGCPGDILLMTNGTLRVVWTLLDNCSLGTGLVPTVFRLE
jgi:hypothetical protein